MASLKDDRETVTVFMNDTVAIVKRERHEKEKLSYTNCQCKKCKEWWIMLCIGDLKKLRCPWCGAKCKRKEIG